jgi:hypothetical protein
MAASGNVRRVLSGAQGVSGMGGASPAAPAVAFEDARKSADQRAARSVAAADMSTLGESLATSDLKRVGARLFKREGNRWTDASMKTGLKVYKVKAYSRSYFALLERLPELREAFSAGDRVLVAGKSVALEVGDDARDLTDAELASIVKGW